MLINHFFFYLGVRSQTTKRSTDATSSPATSTNVFKTKYGNSAAFIIHTLVPYKSSERGFITKNCLYSKYIDRRSQGT